MSERLHVLIVEDNPADVYLLRDALSETGPIGFHSESVPRLSEALARLATGGIDLVIADLGLPDSQGLATFQKLWKIPAWESPRRIRPGCLNSFIRCRRKERREGADRRAVV